MSGRVEPDRPRILGAPEGDAKRAESVARSVKTAGFVSEADLSAVDAELRAEIEAADAAALQAAIDAAAAQGTADDALFEAQFGSVAVGRLAAGTITAAISIQSPYISGGTIEAGTISGGTVSGASISGGTISIGGGDGFSVESDGTVQTFRLERPGAPSDWTGWAFSGATGWYYQISAPGGAFIGTSEIAVRGNRTSSGINWIGSSGGENGWSSFTTAGGDSHRHAVPYHTHTTFI